MKILSVIFLFLPGIFLSQFSFAQDTSFEHKPGPEFNMVDTTIAKEPGFIVMNAYAVKDSIAAFRTWASKMRDTTIEMAPAFIIVKPYALRDSLAVLFGGFASRRDFVIHAYLDSLTAIGNALMRRAEMQDTSITRDPAFIVQDIYASKDRLDAARDALRATSLLAASMQDTTIDIDRSFIFISRYAKKDKYEAFRDSVWAALDKAAHMRDTTILLDPVFIIRDVYATRDRLDASTGFQLWPTIMRDTVIIPDPSFVIHNLYREKDNRDLVRESQTSLADSVYSDSVKRHWAGWKNYEVNPKYAYTLNSQKFLKRGIKTSLQYNIADFYLYINGNPVKPETTDYNFFAAGCLVFKYNDTLLLNSGLGFKVGFGVGIKIIQGKFTSSLHANKHNEQIYKESDEVSVYKKSIVVEPSSHSLKLQFEPAYQSNEIIVGEYRASYKKFYQKNKEGLDEERRITVRIVFRCRVTGGLDTIPPPR